MLKGNLIVGKNQSVVLHASSLEDLLRLAEIKCQGGISLRVDLSSHPLDWEGAEVATKTHRVAGSISSVATDP